MKQLKPSEILDATIATAEVKASGSFTRLFMLGIMAGMFIALGGAAANMGSYFFALSPETAGIAKFVSGMIFPAGLMMVVLGGGELFTGNNLMFVGVMDKKITIGAMLRNWVIVYASNFVGSMIVVLIVVYGGQLTTGGGLLEEVTISIAAGKANIEFWPALIKGILCNVLVCVAVWMGTGADSTVGKVFAMFFPIWAFVTGGYEHCVANMYFVPAGILADGGVTEGLTWANFWINNMIPVTIGNILGGSIFTGAIYYIAFKKGK